MESPAAVRTYYHQLLVEPDCGMCPLRHDKKVLPDGYLPAKLCFVGEGPGNSELIQGLGFVGASGQLLWQLAASYGISRDVVWVTNSSICKPRDVRLSTGAILKEPTVKVLSAMACRRRLVGELLCATQGDPGAVIVPLGNIALQMLSKRRNARIYTYRGAVMQVDLHALWAEVNQQ